MQPYEKDLGRWMRRLLLVWREIHRRPGPLDRLLSAEVRSLGAAVRELSFGLTRDRKLAGARYMEDPRLLGAYLLYFWPVSYMQARQVLGELPSKQRLVLDLGAGPAPAAFAALDAGATQATALDRSPRALELARRLAVEAGEGLATGSWNPETAGRLPEGEVDLVIACHLVNELFKGSPSPIEARAHLLRQALNKVRPGGNLVVIEPALRETSRDLLAVRDLLVASGLSVRAPCLFRGPCPALLKESDWCHADRAWEPPRLVLELARAAGLHKESLKMSYLVVSPRGEDWQAPHPGRLFRIVSEPLAGKGRRRYIGCGPEGRTGLALQEKHRNPLNEDFFRLERGDVVSVTGTETRGDGLSLGKGSEAKRLVRAGRPLGRAP